MSAGICSVILTSVRSAKRLGMARRGRCCRRRPGEIIRTLGGMLSNNSFARGKACKNFKARVMVMEV